MLIVIAFGKYWAFIEHINANTHTYCLFKSKLWKPYRDIEGLFFSPQGKKPITIVLKGFCQFLDRHNADISVLYKRSVSNYLLFTYTEKINFED